MKGQIAACVLLLSLAHGVWSKCPDICTLEYAPVCGSDGRTYSNECFLEVASCKGDGTITKVHDGRCKEPRARREVEDECAKFTHPNICTLEYAPVCASNGQTYPNLCAMCGYMHQQQKEGHDIVLTVEYRGVCKSKMADFCTDRDNTGVCTREYGPICGSDGKTYGNRCTFCFSQFTSQQNGGDLSIAYEGECKSKRNAFDTTIECLPRMKKGICTMEYFPVCGTDGKTYGNKCTFCYGKYQKEENGETLDVDHFGECQSKSDECPEHSHHGICTDDYRPVCGSDGKTYANKCMYCFAKYQKEQNGEELSLDHDGQCQAARAMSADQVECLDRYNTGACTREYFPVCGSDGKTYGNKCTFCYAKHQKQQNGEALTVDHFGVCPVIERRAVDEVECTERDNTGVCTREYFAICGSDGKTYSNKCMFCYAKHQKQQNGEELSVDHFGRCPVIERRAVDEIECTARDNTGVCTREYFAICGSDGKTYSNKCMFCYAKHQKQQNGEELSVDHFGRCPVIERRAVDEVECTARDNTGVCTREYFPICGSDGKVYGNRCTFCYAKHQKQQNGEELTVDHIGECKQRRSVEHNCPESSKHGICTLEYAPVCANNGQTYGNECEMCADMYKRQQEGENIHIHVVHKGVC